MNQTGTEGVFLNGKAQVVEMLQYMEPGEREHLLKQIRLQNGRLADELSAQSIGLEQICTLQDHELKYLFQHIQSPILGISIRELDVSLQKKILLAASRDYAEECYKFMTIPLENESEKIKQAQEKIRGLISHIIKRRWRP